MPRASRPLTIWLLPHAGAGLALAFSILFVGPVCVNTNLFDILPVSRALKSVPGAAHVAEAEKILSNRNGRQVYILTASTDFTEARRGAARLYETFAGSSAFESLSLYVDETVMDQFSTYLHEYRYVLLNGDDRRLLEEGRGGSIAEDALSAVFGAFAFSPLDNLATDPFFLAGRGMNRFLASSLLKSGALSLRDDVLAAQYEGRWYVMLRGTLTPSGVSITNGDSAVEKIYAACASIKAGSPNIGFVYSGVPFHSYESSSEAQREISLISTVTLIIILILFLIVFRSPLPALFSILAVGASLLLAAGTTLLIFREIHILSFVFGTTLIGTCVDYSIHYFIHWKGNPIRSHVMRGITMSFVSTEICFAAMFFAPFGILRQFAVFSLAGMLSSFLTVVCLYPYSKAPVKNRRHYANDSDHASISASNRVLLKRLGLAGILTISLVLLFINRDKVRVENNISSLYTMSGTLRESEKIAAGILDHGSSGWYFIVTGSTMEATLEQEEALRRRLDAEISRGALGSYLAASLFVPSIQTQQQSYEAARLLLPLAEKQLAYLGFPPEAAAEFNANFNAAQGHYVLPEEGLPQGGLPPYLRELISSLWSPAENAYYSCVLPLHAQDESPFRTIAGEFDGVFFMNTVKDIGSELDNLTRIMLFIFLAAYVCIAIVIRFFYSWKKTFRICTVPFLLALVTITVLALLDIPLGFFSVTGLVLVFGLGLDYMFYITESDNAGVVSGSGDRSSTISAIWLSFATTALSFGALALSGFVPVHIFGLTVFTGLTTAFIAVMLLSGIGSENQRNSGGGQ
ncbi:membrane protein [Spirochaetia bacterium]|nr:membrane protein [Spirochaetia bacterium]